VPRDDPVAVRGEVAVGDVQVGTADPTGLDADEDLAPARHRYRALAESKAVP
jgi:hypothetical protein